MSKDANTFFYPIYAFFSHSSCCPFCKDKSENDFSNDSVGNKKKEQKIRGALGQEEGGKRGNAQIQTQKAKKEI